MVEKCSYCGEVGHSIQQCPKWKGKVATASRIQEVWRKFQHGVQTGIYSGFDIDAWLNFAEDAGISRVEARSHWERLGPHSSSPVTVEEMRRALEGMKGLIRAYDFRLLEAVMYAAKTTMKDATERRVFIQDFAAALDRHDLLGSEFVDLFSKHGYVYMEAASQHSSGFHVKYIDLSTGKSLEKDISDREQYDIYKMQREGKISIIDIKKVP